VPAACGASVGIAVPMPSKFASVIAVVASFAT
jgi:hypothetical protein